VAEVAVEARGLVKSYGGMPVVNAVDLSVSTGSVFALLGPNGAGKTTVVRMLATLTAPDGGGASVAGFDVVRERREVRRRISLTGQFAAVDELATGYENLQLMARLAGLGRARSRARAGELLAAFDLVDAGSRRVGAYSGGMRRRLDLAASLVSEPAVLFLDEPTTGLDPRSRNALWAAVRGLVATGVTVMLTTQYLEEADQLADQIALIDAGRIVAQGSPAQLKGRLREQRLELSCVDPAAYDALTQRLGKRVIVADLTRLMIAIPTDGSATEVRGLLDEVDPERRTLRSFEVRSASLDDVFLALTGHRTSAETAASKGEMTHA
jgi:ABC-2 type transport system ATP-binding protein